MTTRPPWNHNIAYHPRVLAAAPRPCRRALDVGCGRGLLTRELLGVADEVVGIDPDAPTLDHARTALAAEPRASFVEGDALGYPFAAGSFDLVATIAALHHMPLIPALTRFRELLAPGGVLAMIGLAPRTTLEDHLMSAAAFPVNRVLRAMKGEAEVGAPIREPRETLPQIRAAAREVLPGARVRLLLLFRYELLWRKPAETPLPRRRTLTPCGKTDRTPRKLMGTRTMARGDPPEDLTDEELAEEVKRAELALRLPFARNSAGRKARESRLHNLRRERDRRGA
jgi:SAM-dependent methyltransferase